MGKYPKRNFSSTYLLLTNFPCTVNDRLGDSGPQTGSRAVPSGWFPCGFHIAGRLGPLHMVGQAEGLRRC